MVGARLFISPCIMPFQNQSLIAVVIGNPPRANEAQHGGASYITRLVDELAKAFPQRAHDIRARTLDLKRRFAVMVQRYHPAFVAQAARQNVAGGGGFVAVPAAAPAVAQLPAELRVRYGIKEQPDVRREVAEVMGIEDKGHEQHGSNFDAPQTLKQIIDNLFKTVSSAQAAEVGQRLMKRYGYDPGK